MKERYETVENLRIKKDKNYFSRYIARAMIACLVFIIFCVMSFSTIYLLVTEKINRSSEGSTANKNSSSKVFNIEMKLRKDLENMTQKNTE